MHSSKAPCRGSLINKLEIATLGQNTINPDKHPDHVLKKQGNCVKDVIGLNIFYWSVQKDQAWLNCDVSLLLHTHTHSHP